MPLLIRYRFVKRIYYNVADKIRGRLNRIPYPIGTVYTVDSYAHK